MDPKNKFTILAFDPGLMNTGWSLLEGNIESGDIHVVKMGEIHAGIAADRSPYRNEVAKYDKRVVTLRLLRESVVELLGTYVPDAVCAEDIFINPRRPNAYGALCMWIAVVKMICRDVANKYLVTIPTKICKREVTGRGDIGKVTVQQAIASNPHIKFDNPEDLANMTEHQADSIAVGATLFTKYFDVITNAVKERNEQSATK